MRERERERLIGQNLGTLGRNEADCCLSMTFVDVKKTARDPISVIRTHTHTHFIHVAYSISGYVLQIPRISTRDSMVSFQLIWGSFDDAAASKELMEHDDAEDGSDDGMDDDGQGSNGARARSTCVSPNVWFHCSGYLDHALVVVRKLAT